MRFRPVSCQVGRVRGQVPDPPRAVDSMCCQPWHIGISRFELRWACCHVGTRGQPHRHDDAFWYMSLNASAIPSACGNVTLILTGQSTVDYRLLTPDQTRPDNQTQAKQRNSHCHLYSTLPRFTIPGLETWIVEIKFSPHQTQPLFALAPASALLAS